MSSSQPVLRLAYMRIEKLFFSAFFLTYLAAAWSLLVTESGIGWAYSDAKNFHIPVIQDIISNWPNPSYRPGLIAMAPGYHWIIATACKSIGLSDVESVAQAAFIFNSFTALVFFSSSWVIIKKLTSDAFIRAACLMLCSASSYTMFSWTWAVTDLSSVAVLAVASAMVAGGQKTYSLAFSFITLTGAFIRQNLITLALAPLLWQVLQWFNLGKKPSSSQVVMITSPLLVAAGFVFFLLKVWGGLSPPDRNHTGSLAATSVGLLHILAFFGFISLPALMAVGPKHLKTIFSRYRPVSVLVIAGVCFVLAFVSNLVGYENQYGSVVWSALRISGEYFGTASSIFVSFSLTFIGAVFFCLMMDASTRSLEMRSIVICLALFLAPHVLMSLHYQRYLEPVALFSIATWVAYASLSRKQVAAICAVYALYFGLSTVRILV
jgi:hypothetical protein